MVQSPKLRPLVKFHLLVNCSTEMRIISTLHGVAMPTEFLDSSFDRYTTKDIELDRLYETKRKRKSTN